MSIHGERGEITKIHSITYINIWLIVLCTSYFSFAVVKHMTKRNHRRKFLFGSREKRVLHVGKYTQQQAAGMQTETESQGLASLTEHMRQTEQTQIGKRLLIPKPPPSDILTPTKLFLLNLPKQQHQLGAKCSNI